MAPPAHRRPGHSRRAQYSVFIGYVAGGVGIALGAIILLVSIANPSFLSGLRGMGADAVAPVSRTVAEGKAGGTGLFEAIRGYLAAGSQNARLRRELAAAKVRLVEAEAQAEENRRLKALLKLAAITPAPVATSRLIGSTSSSTRRYATLGAGRNRGITPGQPIRGPIGLVGRVLEVSSGSSRVLLISDSESVVPIKRANDGLPAYAQGHGDGMLMVRLINLGINPLRIGDRFVTSGSGGIYPPGIPVGSVVKTTRDGALLMAFSNPAASDYVSVIPSWSAQVAGQGGSDGARLPPRPDQ